jgi:hypothetical protein
MDRTVRLHRDISGQHSALEAGVRGAPIFRRLIVSLDHLAPERGAFSYAVGLARCLHLAIHGIAGYPWSFTDDDARGAVKSDRRQLGAHFIEPSDSGIAGVGPRDIGPKCASICAKWDIPWKLCSCDGHSSARLEQFAGEGDLLLLNRIRSVIQGIELFAAPRSPGAPAVLLCSDTWVPPTKVLIVDQGQQEHSGFLEAALNLCHDLQVAPIVLTIGCSQRAAQARQQAVRDELARSGFRADFDFIVGCETHVAAANVARWRRCQFAIVGLHQQEPWWRRFANIGATSPIAWPQSLTFLMLPETALSRSTSEPTGGAPGSSRSPWPHRAEGDAVVFPRSQKVGNPGAGRHRIAAWCAAIVSWQQRL